MKKLGLPLGMLLLSILLVGCSSEDAKVLEILEEVEAQETIIVEQINAVATEEGQLQKQFSETLTDDKELTTMGDASSLVFENIENRKTSLESIKTSISDFSAQADILKEVDGKDLPEEDLKAFQTKLEAAEKSLNEWVEVYENNLQEEENYFKSLSSDDTTYEAFSDGLEKMNEQHVQSNTKLSTIDEELSELSSSRVAIVEQLESEDDKK